MDQFPIELRDVSNCIFYLLFMQNVDCTINLTCTLSGDIIQTPIRHIDMSNLKCLFELDSFKQMIEQIGNKFKCPCCQTDTSLDKFGVDRLLMDAIARLQIQKNSEYQQKQLFVQSSTKTYFAIRKNDNTPISLPGIRKINQSVPIRGAALYLKSIPNIQSELAKYNKLIKIGKQSLNNDFVFSIKTRKEDNKSMIVIYYVHFKVWMNYELKLESGKNYVPFDNALYIKNQQKQCIYVIGGQPSPNEQTCKCFKIMIGQDPFSTYEDPLKVVRIPDLLQEGYNYMGTIVHHTDQSTNIPYESIYIMNGIRKCQRVQSIYQDEVLKVVQVFRNNRWRNLGCREQLEPRLDGSFISYDKDNQRMIFMFGGIKEDQQPQIKCQLFNCSSETISSVEISDTSICQKQPSRIFTLPYYQYNFLLIFKQNQQKNTIYQINSLTGQTQQLQNMRILQQLENLQSFQIDISNNVIQPIFDYEGMVLYGKYQTIQLVQEDKYDLLIINLFDGSSNNSISLLVQKLPYQGREKSQFIARKYFDDLPNQKNQEIQINWDNILNMNG